jgi:hypothetical protein
MLSQHYVECRFTTRHFAKDSNHMCAPPAKLTVISEAAKVCACPYDAKAHVIRGLVVYYDANGTSYSGTLLALLSVKTVVSTDELPVRAMPTCRCMLLQRLISNGNAAGA